jgi:hypothetical protein
MVRELQNSDGAQSVYVRYLTLADLLYDGNVYTEENPPPFNTGAGDVRYWLKEEDYTENYGDSIGDNSLDESEDPDPKKAIDITNRQLVGTDGATVTLEFGDIADPIADLAGGATLADVIAKVNDILAALRERKIIDTAAP